MCIFYLFHFFFFIILGFLAFLNHRNKIFVNISCFSVLLIKEFKNNLHFWELKRILLIMYH